MLDRDLAALYGVETKVLNQSVKRNISRFPKDFMFQLTAEEATVSSVCFYRERGRNAQQCTALPNGYSTRLTIVF